MGPTRCSVHLHRLLCRVRDPQADADREGQAISEESELTMDIEEADERLASGWHVDPSGLNPQDSPQRRRYLKTVDGYGRQKDQDGQRQST